jgi:hypothetical protein
VIAIQKEQKSFLQVLLEKNPKSQNALFEQSEIARSLQCKIDDTRKMMVKVVNVIEKEKQLNESLSSELHNRTGTTFRTLTRVNRLQTQTVGHL